MVQALYYKKVQDNCVKCELCPRECFLHSGQKGYCRGRVNYEGELRTQIYGRLSSMAIDPIEKKPLYHFYPGSEILSVGTVGCNLSCQFCQNWRIAQSDSQMKKASSDDLVEIALRYNSIGIAYTYSEPLIWYEFIIDTAKKAQKVGLKNVLVTNGFIYQKPLKELLFYIDGLNLDVKGFRQDFYTKVCGGGDLEVVKQTAELAAKHCHLEVTTLLIPGLNDDPGELKQLSEWLAGISPDIPLHFSRYFPQHKLDLPPTSVESLQMAKEIGEKALHYVYLGNLSNEDRNTYCPNCRYPVVKRNFQIKVNLKEGLCPKCGIEIPIIID